MNSIRDFLSQPIGSIKEIPSGQFYSSETIHSEINQKVADFMDIGINSSSRVIITYGNSKNFIVDLLAMWRLGACAIPLAKNTTAYEMQKISKFVEPRAILFDEYDEFDAIHEFDTKDVDHSNDNNPENDFADIRRTNLLLGRSQSKQSRANQARSHGQSPEHINSRESNGNNSAVHQVLDEHENAPALILFTSGSTGTPKGVVLSFHAIQHRITTLSLVVPESDLDCTLALLPTHFGYGLISNVLFPLFNSKHVYLGKPFSLQSLGNFTQTIHENDVTFFCSTPSMWQIILRVNEPLRQHKLKRVHCAAAPLEQKLWHKIHDFCGGQTLINNVLGSTETCCTFGGVTDGLMPVDGFLGKSWDGQYKLENTDLYENGCGELWVKTPGIMKGYFKNQHLTNTVIKEGWYCTGDIGYFLADGSLILVGRRKDIINYGGVKIAPNEIDSILIYEDNIIDACCFALPDEIAGEILAAAIQFSPFPEILSEKKLKKNLTNLKKQIQTKIQPEKVPRQWFIVEKIPRTDRGKINRDIVRDYCLENAINIH